MSDLSERWLPVVGYEGYYEVSNRGRVRSVRRTVAMSDGRQRTYPGRMIASTPGRDGRHMVQLCRNGGRVGRLTAVLVLLAFKGPRPPGMVACHNDGVCTNDVPSNLRWDTQASNVRDAVLHGTNSSTRKTHCPRGHALVEPNLIRVTKADGRRQCLACNRAYGNVTHAKRTGRPHDFLAWADDHYARIMEAAHDRADDTGA